MRRIGLIFTALALVAGGVVAGCATGSVDYPPPATWTVAYAGQNYCGYMYDPHEIDMYGSLACSRVVFPSMSAVAVPGTLNYALLTYLETYDAFYHSGYWYDQYYAPLGARYHVTVINRTSYLSYSHDFEAKYAPAIKTQAAKAKWGNGKTGAYQFPASNSKARNKPLTNAGGGAGYAGTDNSNAAAAGTTGKSGTTAKAPPVRSKPGTTSRRR